MPPASWAYLEFSYTVLLCVVSVVARAAGMFVIGSFQVGTLLQAGMAMMILGCLAYLAVLVDGARD